MAKMPTLNSLFIRKAIFLMISFTGLIVIIIFFLSSSNESNNTQEEYEVGNVPLLKAHPFSVENTKTELIAVSENGSVIPYMSAMGGINESISDFTKYKVTSYRVKKGDTVDSLATLFNVSPMTIRFQNGITKKNPLKVDMVLAILPIDGVSHVYKSGESLESIARKYKGDISEIEMYNDLARSSKIPPGAIIIIPGGTEYVPPKPKITKKKETILSKIKNKTIKILSNGSNKNYYMHPMAGRGVLTQGYHGGFRAIDIGAQIGVPVVASAAGAVMVASSGTYGGGYGNYIVILHPNGSKTLYGHLSRVSVSLGQSVKKGQIIGASGNSGRSTGPHLHFEIRDGIPVPCESFGYGACD